ncbi:MAG: hypothetical protein U5O39_10005 [Gammaproteobacteria bacterium]|nr:hypothetical protein [Gammaproteobacteria bacterium]
MAIYDISSGKLTPLEATTFASSEIKEREHLQQLLRKQIDVVAPNTLIISEEFSNWQDSKRRIDLLGVNAQGNLVVIELKRNEDGGHMELQALRYAAMVSSLTFDQAIEIYEDYLSAEEEESDVDARSKLLEFLDWESEEENEFAQDVQIVLASANFSKEITTTVLWLNDMGLDIQCVRLKPYKDGDRTLVDIQQVIPLPEAEAYQVQVKRKTRLEHAARRQNRDLTKYTVTVGDESFEHLAKRRAMIHFVRALYDNGVDPKDMITALSRNNAFRVLPNELHGNEVVESLRQQQEQEGLKPKPRRWFIGDDEVMRRDGKTYVLTKMWGSKTELALSELKAAFPSAEVDFKAER